jgi:hypothetical protein
MAPLASVLLLASFAGCCCTQSSKRDLEPPPVQGVLVYWDKNLYGTQDPTRQGVTIPGLAGRLWVQGEDPRQMLEAKGLVFAELYDMTPTRDGGSPKKVAEITYDTAALKKVHSHDMLGEGYTIFVPFEAYRPEVTEVMLKLFYQEENGQRHYGTPELVKLQTNSRPQVQLDQRTVQAGYQVPERK